MFIMVSVVAKEVGLNLLPEQLKTLVILDFFFVSILFFPFPPHYQCSLHAHSTILSSFLRVNPLDSKCSLYNNSDVS